VSQITKDENNSTPSIEAQQLNLFKSPYKIFVFNINNNKDDYAFAFRFIMHNFENVLYDEKTMQWIKVHIKYLNCYENINKNVKNENLMAIYEYEERCLEAQSLSHIEIMSEFNDNDFFYFRVTSNDEDDIVNLHYFFLANSQCGYRCCISIIPNKDSLRYTIADYLLCEMLEFESKNSFCIEKSKENRKVEVQKNAKYQIKLIESKKENFFFLIKKKNKYYPQSINKKRVYVTHKFFPQMRIKQSLFYAFAQYSEDFCKSLVLNRNKESDKNKLILKDILYEIALLTTDIDFEDEHKLANNLGKQYWFSSNDITECLLLNYCYRCYDNLKIKKNKEKLDKFILERTTRSSVLAVCFFLSYLSLLDIDEISESKWSDIFTDTEDYAASILQLIENTIKHSYFKEGIFCFRIHDCEKEEPIVFQRLSKRYNINKDSSINYYLEILISDFNATADITETFKENINYDLAKQKDKKEYIISDSKLLEQFSNFKLRDMFEYDSCDNTKAAWEKFHHEPKNLISHYGLLVFDHLVSFAKGAFQVFSSKHFNVEPDSYYVNCNKKILTSSLHIPGTQYEILLPIGISKSPYKTGLNSDLKINDEFHDYKSYIIKNELFSELVNINFINDLSNIEKYFFYQPNNKVELINNISAKILDYIRENFNTNLQNVVLTCDVSHIDTPIASEIFAKIVIAVLYSKEINEFSYLALINASDTFLSTFTRVFSILYMKCRQNKIMKDRQIYLCSPALEKEIIFYGESLMNAVNATEKISLRYKGEPINELKILQREAEKSYIADIKDADSYISIIPFDIILNLFWKKVNNDLVTDIQEKAFGCCLKNTHMRVGTKIHTWGNFYEASLLFSVSGYVSRFAYFIIEDLVKILSNEFVSENYKFVIIGYENYSESLLIHIKENLPKAFEIRGYDKILVEYLIYRESSQDVKFHRWDIVKPDENTRFMIIVPVGSTLTTHAKIVADLCREVLLTSDDVIKLESVISHHTIILVRDSKEKNMDNGTSKIEKIFWDKITFSENNQGKIIYRKDMGNISLTNQVNFFVAVEHDWYLPNECPRCFPAISDLTQEKPLVLANRTSVVPMTMYNIKRGENKDIKNAIKSINYDIKKFSPLMKTLCYGHITRDKDNHFEYYFKTDEVMDEILQNENLNSKFKKWLYESIMIAKKEEKDIYYHDFIIAPLHDTSAKFVHEVNKVLCAQQIIWLDTKREFRDNILSKFSNLTSLYENLYYSDKNTSRIKIRFHFVDDTINSGSSFYRTQSLINSLFTSVGLNHSENIECEIFSSIFLLINRCSSNTQANYIKEPLLRFYSFFNLNISSMRSHKDACVMCKNHLNFYSVIPRRSSSYSIAQFSWEKSKKYEMRPSENIFSSKDKILPTDKIKIENKCKSEFAIENMQRRDYYRLILTHRMNEMLKNIKHSNTETKMIESLIWVQLNEICSLDYSDNKKANKVTDLFFSLIKIISRPFLSFKKIVSEAALKIIIEITDYSLNKNYSCLKNEPNISAFINYILDNNRLRLIKLLFSCLANMGSTFLVRVSTINSVLDLCSTYSKNDIRVGLISNYVFHVKRILCLGGKNNLPIWLEKLIKTGMEPYPEDHSNIVISKNEPELASKLLKYLLLENNNPIYEALEECDKKWKYLNYDNGKIVDVIQKTLDDYYCKTYCEFIGIDSKNDKTKFDEYCNKDFRPILLLFHHLHEKQRDKESKDIEVEYYDKLMMLTRLVFKCYEMCDGKYCDNCENKLKKDCDKIRLFVHAIPDVNTEDDVYQVFPHVNKIKDDDLLLRFVNHIAHEKEHNYIEIGRTLFYQKCEKGYIGSIKITMTHLMDISSEYYLAFELPNLDDENEIISRARNLLVMRYLLMYKIYEDFDNHIRNELIAYQQKVRQLGIDKSRSHTPFTELSKLFDENELLLKNLLQNCRLSTDEVNEQSGYYINQLMIIADSLISKWYVHNIVRSYPDKLNPNDVEIRRGIPLEDCKDVLESLIYGFIHEDGAIIYPDESSSISTDSWGEVEIDCPDRCLFIWCCAIIASFYNALRHGRVNEEDANASKRRVNIEVLYNNGYVFIRNRQKDNSTDANNPKITLDALRYFFDTFYGKNEFYSDVDPDNNQYYLTKIPCRSKEVKDYGTYSRY